MALDEDLRTEIIAASTTLGKRVHQNVIPQHQGITFPRCWFTRAARVDDLDMDGTRGALLETHYDVECHSSTLDDAITAADSIRTGLNGKRGTFGAGTIKGCFVDDQDDDYIPRGTGEDAGVHVSALRIRIFST